MLAPPQRARRHAYPARFSCKYDPRLSVQVRTCSDGMWCSRYKLTSALPFRSYSQNIHIRAKTRITNLVTTMDHHREFSHYDMSGTAVTELSYCVPVWQTISPWKIFPGRAKALSPTDALRGGRRCSLSRPYLRRISYGEIRRSSEHLLPARKNNERSFIASITATQSGTLQHSGYSRRTYCHAEGMTPTDTSPTKAGYSSSAHDLTPPAYQT